MDTKTNWQRWIKKGASSVSTVKKKTVYVSAHTLRIKINSSSNDKNKIIGCKISPVRINLRCQALRIIHLRAWPKIKHYSHCSSSHCCQLKQSSRVSLKSVTLKYVTKAKDKNVWYLSRIKVKLLYTLSVHLIEKVPHAPVFPFNCVLPEVNTFKVYECEFIAAHVKYVYNLVYCTTSPCPCH